MSTEIKKRDYSNRKVSKRGPYKSYTRSNPATGTRGAYAEYTRSNPATGARGTYNIQENSETKIQDMMDMEDKKVKQLAREYGLSYNDALDKYLSFDDDDEDDWD